MKRILAVFLVCLIPGLAGAVIKTPTPTNTKTNTPTITSTPTNTFTATPVGTQVGPDGASLAMLQLTQIALQRNGELVVTATPTITPTFTSTFTCVVCTGTPTPYNTPTFTITPTANPNDIAKVVFQLTQISLQTVLAGDVRAKQTVTLTPPGVIIVLTVTPTPTGTCPLCTGTPTPTGTATAERVQGAKGKTWYASNGTAQTFSLTLTPTDLLEIANPAGSGVTEHIDTAQLCLGSTAAGFVHIAVVVRQTPDAGATKVVVPVVPVGNDPQPVVTVTWNSSNPTSIGGSSVTMWSLEPNTTATTAACNGFSIFGSSNGGPQLSEMKTLDLIPGSYMYITALNDQIFPAGTVGRLNWIGGVETP